MKGRAQTANDVQMAHLAIRGHQIARIRQIRVQLVNTLVEQQLFVIHAVQGNTMLKQGNRALPAVWLASQTLNVAMGLAPTLKERKSLISKRGAPRASKEDAVSPTTVLVVQVLPCHYL
jgi:hypothetical protein